MMMVKAKELGLLFEAHLACWESPKGEEEDPRSPEGGWTVEYIRAGFPAWEKRSCIALTQGERA